MAKKSIHLRSGGFLTINKVIDITKVQPKKNMTPKNPLKLIFRQNKKIKILKKFSFPDISRHFPTWSRHFPSVGKCRAATGNAGVRCGGGTSIASPWFRYCTLSEYFSPILHPKTDKLIRVIRVELFWHVNANQLARKHFRGVLKKFRPL